MPTKKKRLMVALSDEDLRNVEKLKLVLYTKQLSKVISYCLEVVGNNVVVDETLDPYWFKG